MCDAAVVTYDAAHARVDDCATVCPALQRKEDGEKVDGDDETQRAFVFATDVLVCRRGKNALAAPELFLVGLQE